MNHPPSPTEHPLSSIMSELDSLSDSDWLDIASGRDSEDNDSLSDTENSDRDEISSMPHSRRSSISNDDSLSSDVEAWEGFVSDSGDEASEAVIGMYPAPLPSPLGAEPIAIGFDPTMPPVVDEATEEEDKRVREALDQSFVGTLSASSRSVNATGSAHSTSAHTSIRDLRLSFPDPLTSSRDELNRSYETVSSPTETTVSSSTDNDETVPERSQSTFPSPPIEDPGLLSTTPEVQHHEVHHSEIEEKSADLEIVLYGTSSEIKWKFVQELIHNATTASDCVAVNSLREDEQIQSLRFINKSNKITNFFDAIDVFDRTNTIASNIGVDNIDYLDRPSLAVVYLPTAKLPVLGWHDAYLPIIVPNSNPDFDSSIILQNAEDDWDLLGVPSDRVLKFGTNKLTVFTPEELIRLDPSLTLETLRGIGHDSKKIGGLKPLPEQIKSVNAVKLVAIVSIILGFAMNTAFRSSTPAPTPTIHTSSSSASAHHWGAFVTQPNHSIATASLGPASTNSSPKEMSLSVFNPGVTSLSVTPPPASKGLSVASTSSKEVARDSKVSPATKCQQCAEGSSSKSGSSEKQRASTDVAVRSTATSLSEVSYITPTVSTIAPRTDGRSGTSIILSGTERLSVIPKSTVATVASAAAQIDINGMLDATAKALVEAMATDLTEMVEVADVLLNNLLSQADDIKGKARAIGEQFQEGIEYRNKRAKRKAKELGQAGGEFFRDATKGLKQRTMKAQRKAKKIKDVMVEGGAEAWKTYEKAQGEWEGVLLRKGNGEESSDKGRGQDKENVNPRKSRGCTGRKDKPGGRFFRRGLQVNDFL